MTLKTLACAAGAMIVLEADSAPRGLMMPFAFQEIEVERRGNVHCVRLKKTRLTEADQLRLGEELGQLVAEEKCQRLALGLGNDHLDCLYSMFLGKLVGTRRLIHERGGHMHLVDVGPASLGVLKTCSLTDLFEIHDDMDAAVKALESLD